MDGGKHSLKSIIRYKVL